MSLSAGHHDHHDHLMSESIGVPVDPEYEKKLRNRIREFLQYKHDGFPGSQPVSFEASHFAYLEEEDYYVCEKSDGIRYIMFAEISSRGPATFLLDRKNKIWFVRELQLPMKEPNKFHHETMMDGELVRDVDGDVTRLRYLVFDLMVLNGKQHTNRSFSSRLGIFREEVLKPLQSRLKKGHQRQIFSVEIKEMERSYGLHKVFQMMPSLKHNQDGLVFTPVKSGYVAGTDKKLLKWKPPNLNTVDFQINVKWTRERKPIYELFIATSGVHKFHDALTLDEPTAAKWRPNPPNGKIGEFWWDPHWHTIKYEEGYGPDPPRAGGWRFVRFRDDKDMANDESVLEKIKHSIADNVTREMLEKSCEKIRTQWKMREQRAQESQQKGDRIQIPHPLSGPMSAHAGVKHIPPTPSIAEPPQKSPIAEVPIGNPYFPSNDRRDQPKHEDSFGADNSQVTVSLQASGQRADGDDRRAPQDSHGDVAPSTKPSYAFASSEAPMLRARDEQQTSSDDVSLLQQYVHQTRSRRTSQTSTASGHSLQGRSRRPSQETQSPNEELTVPLRTTAEDAIDAQTAPGRQLSDANRTRADLQNAPFRRSSAEAAQIPAGPRSPVENPSADIRKPQTQPARRTTDDDHRLAYGPQTPPPPDTSEGARQTVASHAIPDRRYSGNSYQMRICETPERRSSTDQAVAQEQTPPNPHASQDDYNGNIPLATARQSGDVYQEADRQTSQRRLSGGQSYVQQTPVGRPSGDEQGLQVTRTPSRRSSGDSAQAQDVQPVLVGKSSGIVPGFHETHMSRRLSSPITQSSYQTDARQRLPSIDEVYHTDAAVEEPPSHVRPSPAVGEDAGRGKEQTRSPSAFPHVSPTPSAPQHHHFPYPSHESNAQPPASFLSSAGSDMQVVAGGVGTRGQLYQSGPMGPLVMAEPQNGQVLKTTGDEQALPHQQHIFINYSNNPLAGSQTQPKPPSSRLDALAAVAAMDAPQLTQPEPQEQEQPPLYSSPPSMAPYTQQYTVAPYPQPSSSSPPPESSGRPALPQKRKSKATLDFILNDPAPPVESESKRGRLEWE